MAQNQTMRLDQYLARMGTATRSVAKRLVRSGMVEVNETIVRSADYKVRPGQDVVLVNGQAVLYEPWIYPMLHKPAGCVSATQDAKEQTVLDYIEEEDCARKAELFLVGRLDKDSEGLVLLTNDGALSHRLLSPRRHVKKQYYVRLKEPLAEGIAQKFAAGLDIGDEKPALPAEIEAGADAAEAMVWIREGRFHQIKRMFQACGNEVVYLKRLAIGSLVLDEALAPGEYRRLTTEEVGRLKEEAGC